MFRLTFMTILRLASAYRSIGSLPPRSPFLYFCLQVISYVGPMCVCALINTGHLHLMRSLNLLQLPINAVLPFYFATHEKQAVHVRQ